MHRDHAAEARQFVGLAGGFERDQHADLAQTVDHRIVHVGADRALADRQSRRAAQCHVLADLGNGVGDGIGNRDAASLGRVDFFDVRAGGERDVGDHLDQALEQVVAGDEVGFRIDLDHDALGALHQHADQTFGGDAAGFLRRFRETLLAQPVLRRRHIALRLGERGLAIHHAGAGRLAQFLDHLGRDIRHRRHYSAVSSLAFAIQPSTRPGKPTSSPTLCAAVAESSAICEK